MAEFQAAKDNKGEWYWIFLANNNKTIARSSESYQNRGDCLHSIRLVKELTASAVVWDMTTNPASTIATLP